MSTNSNNRSGVSGVDASDPLVQTILTYYQGCNGPDLELMLGTFAPDVVHYFVDHAPVRGAQALANYWAKIGPKTQSHWTVDKALVHRGIDGEEAVIEWSMQWQPPMAGQKTGADQAAGAMELLRGTEWFVFVAGKIAEIRSYHNNVHLQGAANAQLHDFPYAERGYTLLS